MKTTSTLCLAISLALATMGTAQADRGRHDGNYRQYQRNYDHRNSIWDGPATFLAITGLAIGAIAMSQANTTPVYVAPSYTPPGWPIQAPADSGSWYYCGSAGQYYPYVRYCDEGWQTVMPPRQ
jgi:hypothetical protein